jgi:hypothetical protein
VKPFNLEEAKAGKSLCTRDGRNARIICYDCKKEKYPIVALITNNNSNDTWEDFEDYSIKGSYMVDEEHDLDLFIAPEKKKLMTSEQKEDVKTMSLYDLMNLIQKTPEIYAWSDPTFPSLVIIDEVEKELRKSIFPDKKSEINFQNQMSKKFIRNLVFNEEFIIKEIKD